MKRTALMMAVILTLLCGCGKADTVKTTETTKKVQSTTITTTEEEATVTTASTTATTIEATTTTTTGGDVVTTTSNSTKTTTTRATTVKTTKATKPSNPQKPGVTLLSPDDGAIIDPMTPAVREYMAITKEKDAAQFWVVSHTENDTGSGFTASWKGKDRSLYEVVWADNAEMKNAVSFKVIGKSYPITGLLHGKTYYWKVVDVSNDTESEVRSVHILDGQVRWIDADGGRNIRDLGGWKTESGKTVQYGMLYRGACVDGKNGIALTSTGKQQFRDILGIKTQLDLRGSDDGDNGAQSSSDFGVAYVKAVFNQYDYIFTDSYSRESLRKIFDVLSDEANYPIYFHCNAGADRTGTLAFIINGLLGVSHDDLTRDFELTGMAIGNRLRSFLDTSTGEAVWDPSGVMMSGGSNYIAWGPLYEKMMTNYGTGDGKLSSAIENFLKAECGVPQQQIDDFRRFMLK